MKTEINLEQPDFTLHNSHSEEVSQANIDCKAKEVDESLSFVNFKAEDENKNTSDNPLPKTKIDRAESVDGSGSKTYGKFKDAEKLFEAYNNLQSDYTKKCQSLACLQKRLESDASKNSFEIIDTLKTQSEDFFAKNPQSEKLKQEIFSTLQQDKDLIQTQNPFEQAWIKCLKQNFKTKDDLINDPQFLQDYVLTNKNIKDKILNEYFFNIHTQENPTLMSTQKGSQMVLSSRQTPKTLEDAEKLVEDMFS